MTSPAPTFYPPPLLRPATWGGLQRLLHRCLQLAGEDALPTTLLLVGEPGMGREAMAVELAAALTCRSSPLQRCSCSSCDRVRRGIHPDVQLMRPRSAAERRGESGAEDEAAGKGTISIDDVRELVATLDRHPYEGRRRVVILDSVHTPPLGVEAAVALLKSLEEPPPKVVFLALAGSPRHVLPTIVSRTVEVRIPPPTHEEAVQHLAVHLGLPVESARARLAAAGSDLVAALTLPEEEPGALARLVASAVRGDGVALGVLARRLKQEGTTVPLVTAIIAALRAQPMSEAEELLFGAAALLTSQRLASALNLGVEAVAAGRLSQLS